MKLFDKLFGKKNPEKTTAPAEPASPEHAVIVKFLYGFENLDPLDELDEELRDLLADTATGEYDGYDISADSSDGTLYMYGPDAQQLFATVKPTLEKTAFLKGAVATLRLGPPQEGVKELKVIINKGITSW